MKNYVFSAKELAKEAGIDVATNPRKAYRAKKYSYKLRKQKEQNFQHKLKKEKQL